MPTGEVFISKNKIKSKMYTLLTFSKDTHWSWINDNAEPILSPWPYVWHPTSKASDPKSLILIENT